MHRYFKKSRKPHIALPCPFVCSFYTIFCIFNCKVKSDFKSLFFLDFVAKKGTTFWHIVMYEYMCVRVFDFHVCVCVCVLGCVCISIASIIVIRMFFNFLSRERGWLKKCQMIMVCSIISLKVQISFSNYFHMFFIRFGLMFRLFFCFF